MFFFKFETTIPYCISLDDSFGRNNMNGLGNLTYLTFEKMFLKVLGPQISYDKFSFLSLLGWSNFSRSSKPTFYFLDYSVLNV